MLIASEVVNEIPVDPIAFGLGAMAIFVLLLVATLLFGKGRPHA